MHIMSIVVTYHTNLAVSCFNTKSSCLSRFQIFFLDNKSETCQKFCSSSQFVFPVKIQKIKIHVLVLHTHQFRTKSCHFGHFQHFVFQYKEELPCEILDIFSRQEIWDLSKSLKLISIRTSSENSENQKITHSSHISTYFVQISCHFRRFQLFVLWYKELLPCKISDIFSRQEIWDLSKNL